MDGRGGGQTLGSGPLVSSFLWRLSPHLQVIRALMENGCCSWGGPKVSKRGLILMHLERFYGWGHL